MENGNFMSYEWRQLHPGDTIQNYDEHLKHMGCLSYPFLQFFGHTNIEWSQGGGGGINYTHGFK